MEWPDIDIPADTGNVIILSAEDDPGDTIKPRLLAAGADMKLCHVLNAVKTFKDGKVSARGFDLSRDIDRLAGEVEKIGNVRLAIIDPISAYQGKTDSHNNADIRGLLAPLSKMAAELNLAVILVTHMNKSKDTDPLMRVMGSVGLIAAARAGYVVIKDESNHDTRYFMPIKNNIGNDRDGLAYFIEPVTLPQGLETSKIQWHPGLVDSQKILSPVKKAVTNEAQAFLESLLSPGPMLASEVFEHAEGTGFKRASIQRASRILKVKKKKLGMKDGWSWALPNHPEGNEDYEEHTPPDNSPFAEDAAPSQEDTSSNGMKPSTPS